jgi:hypothetical protein
MRPYKFPGYTVAMYFQQFECAAGKIKPEGATGTWFYIGFNDFPFFTGNNSVGEDFRLPHGQQMFYSNYRLTGKLKSIRDLRRCIIRTAKPSIFQNLTVCLSAQFRKPRFWLTTKSFLRKNESRQ